MMGDDRLALSAKDLAGMLSISTRQLYSWHSTGTLGPMPLALGPRCRRWDAREIREWWAASKAAGRPIPRTEWLRREGGQS